jgi:hypothetical protein
MPDVTASSWFPVLTLLIGFATKSLTDWFEHRHHTRRDREAREAVRRDQLFERRTSFQRQTLLDLQEACAQLVRTAGAIQHQDYVAYRSTGKWTMQQVPDDLAEGNRLAQARTGMLIARVRDDTVRELTDKLKTHAGEVIRSQTHKDSQRAEIDMLEIYTRLNERIGQVLRTLDDVEQEHFP